MADASFCALLMLEGSTTPLCAGSSVERLSTSIRRAHEEAPRGPERPWRNEWGPNGRVLGTLCAVLFLTFLDLTIVSVALADVQSKLHASIRRSSGW